MMPDNFSSLAGGIGLSVRALGSQNIARWVWDTQSCLQEFVDQARPRALQRVQNTGSLSPGKLKSKESSWTIVGNTGTVLREGHMISWYPLGNK